MILNLTHILETCQSLICTFHLNKMQPMENELWGNENGVSNAQLNYWAFSQKGEMRKEEEVRRCSWGRKWREEKTCCFKAKTNCVHSKSKLGFVAICQSNAALLALIMSYSWAHFSSLELSDWALLAFHIQYDSKCQRNTFDNHAKSQHVVHARRLCGYLGDRTS